MTPGSYLRQCREAAGLTLDDIALCTETVPPVSARSRAEWLATIEADAAPLAFETALRLHMLFDFDWDVLAALPASDADALVTSADLQMCLPGHFAEAKGRGYDPKAIRKILSIRRRKKADWQEEEAILEVYMQALGML